MTRNDKFNDSMPSFEELAEERDISKWAVLSDNNSGAEAILDAADNEHKDNPPPPSVPGVSCPSCESCASCSPCPLSQAMLYLILLDKGHLAPTLVAIAQNRGDQEAAIRSLAQDTENGNYDAVRRKYFRHRNELTEVFTNPCVDQ